MPDVDATVRQIILDRLDRLEAKIDVNQEKTNIRLQKLEGRVNWAFAFVSGIAALLTATGQKIYAAVFGG